MKGGADFRCVQESWVLGNTEYLLAVFHLVASLNLLEVRLLRLICWSIPTLKPFYADLLSINLMFGE